MCFLRIGKIGEILVPGNYPLLNKCLCGLSDNGQITLANLKVPKLYPAYAVVEGPGTWKIRSSNSSRVIW